MQLYRLEKYQPGIRHKHVVKDQKRAIIMNNNNKE